MNLSNVLGNLTRLCDSSLQDYKSLKESQPDNFYASLLYIIKQFLPSTNKEKSTNTTSQRVILGNSIILEYAVSKRQVRMIINGGLAASETLGKNTLVSLFEQAVLNEVKGNFEVKRPKGRTLAKDQIGLNENTLRSLGISLSSRFSSLLKKNAGQAAKKGSANKQVLSEEEFKYLSNKNLIDKESYLNVGNYYVTSKSEVFFMISDIEPLTHIDEALAREPGLLEFYERNIDKNIKSFVLSKQGVLYQLYKGYMKRLI